MSTFVVVVVVGVDDDDDDDDDDTSSSPTSSPPPRVPLLFLRCCNIAVPSTINEDGVGVDDDEDDDDDDGADDEDPPLNCFQQSDDKIDAAGDDDVRGQLCRFHRRQHEGGALSGGRQAGRRPGETLLPAAADQPGQGGRRGHLRRHAGDHQRLLHSLHRHLGRLGTRTITTARQPLLAGEGKPRPCHGPLERTVDEWLDACSAQRCVLR